MTDWRRDYTKLSAIPKVCKRCGVEYVGGGYKYCSRTCAYIHKPMKRREFRPCASCGVPTWRKYCSRACSSAGQRVVHEPVICKGCGLPWSPSKSQRRIGYDTCWPCRQPKPRKRPYRDIKAGLKKRLVAREKGRCQDCRKTAEMVGEPLHAHHVVPQALGGDNTLGNLKLLCPDCHVGSGYERNHSLLLMAGLVEAKKAA